MIQTAIIFIIITLRPGLNTVNTVSQLSHLVKCARAQILEHSQIIILYINQHTGSTFWAKDDKSYYNDKNLFI